MPSPQPIEQNVTRYWRDSRFAAGCVSERNDLAAPLADTTTPEEVFELRLLDAGFTFDQASRASEVFAGVFAEHSAARVVDSLRELLLKISTTKTGKTPEFRAILAIFSPGRTLEDVADEAGLNRQTVAYHRDKLLPFFAPDPALVE